MLSRVADALYWMGRYIERAEHCTRLLLVAEDFSTEIQGLDEPLAQTEWTDLLATFPGSRLTQRPFPAYTPFTLPYLFSFYLEELNPHSTFFSLRKARENARRLWRPCRERALIKITCRHAITSDESCRRRTVRAAQ